MFLSLNEAIENDDEESGIKAKWIASAINECLAKQADASLDVFVNCGGGNVDVTATIVAMLERFSETNTLTIHYVGQASSAIMQLFSLSNAKHVVYPHCFGVIHSCSTIRSNGNNPYGVDSGWRIMAEEAWAVESKTVATGCKLTLPWPVHEERMIFPSEIFELICFIQEQGPSGNKDSRVTKRGDLTSPCWKLRSKYSKLK